ncbi:MAG: hypothetical protein JO266_10475 [Acidobacteria bacterium]|nr:hypothetical protein [Acidobacteriota bacterium]
MAEVGQSRRPRQAPGLVWWSMVAGPIAWAADLGFSYVLAQHACSTQHRYVLHLISMVCFVIALTGLAAGFAEQRKLPAEVTDKGPRPFDRAYFQVLFGMVFSIAFALIVVAGAIPRWILSPCD